MPTGNLRKQPNGLAIVAGNENYLVAKSALSEEVKQKVKDLNKSSVPIDFQVDFEVEGGKPCNIRPAENVDLSVVGIAAMEATTSAALGGFNNPFNFIHGLDRSHLTKENSPPSGLGDGKPFGHHAYHPDLLSGWIEIELETATPLLLTDAATAQTPEGNTKHAVFKIRKDEKGLPYFPPASIKGAMSSAYEAITNSRLRMFQKHDGRLGKRMDAREGVKLIPAQIRNGRVQLLKGCSSISTDGSPVAQEMYAAWLSRYSAGSLLSYVSGGTPKHLDKVECIIEKIQHWVFDKKKQKHVNNFDYWKVREIVPKGGTLSGANPTPTVSPPESTWNRNSYHVSLKVFDRVTGVVCVSNKNIKNKHDERVFFCKTTPQDAGSVELIEDRWKDLITDYQETHRDEICKKRSSGPQAMPGCEWSRHIGNGESGKLSEDERELKEGMLCYVKVKKTPTGFEAVDVFPVNISRELFDKAPSELVYQSLLPARSFSEFSPADRVFGWVHSNANELKKIDRKSTVAYKGQIRVGPTVCLTEEAIDTFAFAGVPLAILSTPKPSQASFYVQENGKPVPSKNGGYKSSQQLRHRKVYPHHKHVSGEELAGYWRNPTEDRTQTAINGQYQAYRQPHNGVDVPHPEKRWLIVRKQNPDGTFEIRNGEENEQRSDQNRSVTEWVKIGTKFRFRLHVVNLSQVEIGALLWMLSLDEQYPDKKHFLRMGGGKPLGFGSLNSRIVDSRLETGAAKSQAYFTLAISQSTEQSSLRKDLVTAFIQSAGKAYSPSGDFEKIDFIQSFLACCRGYEGPVHYPRSTKSPDPGGENFKWFGGPNPLPVLKTNSDRLPLQ